MYCDKENVNILTDLLVQSGVKHVVVCPGSRNAPLVHNFSQHPQLICHPVTDERSAGFMALGIALQTQCNMVAVCVTSGSALLNLIPAIAEAAYQKCGLIVISADRPTQWIDQLDGQTIAQPGALHQFVSKTVDLPEPNDEEESWYCNRLVNEAITTLQRTNKPVHINVPISEPFFDFNTIVLAKQRIVRYVNWSIEPEKEAFKATIKDCRKPMLVFGQMPFGEFPSSTDKADVVALYEQLSANTEENSMVDQLIFAIENDTASYNPDLLIYFGGHTASKRLRKFMRQLPEDCVIVMVDEDGELKDVSKNASYLIQGKSKEVAAEILNLFNKENACIDQEFLTRWKELKARIEEKHQEFQPAYSSMKAVKLFEENYKDGLVFYANSMSVRLGAIYSDKHYGYCNRGINGIEGSLSTAAGAALSLQETSKQNVYCIIGDLSFFYDENALWQQQLSGNFRILLLNNNEGAIFRNLKGLEASPAREGIISAHHNLTAEGICQQFAISYKQINDDSELKKGIDWLMTAESNRPVVLEVITKAEEDERVYKKYYKAIAARS